MKRQRHEVVVELINKYDIETQEELAAYLREAGFDVTQATVSRDIRELKLSKIATGNGKQKYIILQNEDSRLGDKYIRVLRDGFVSMNMAQNMGGNAMQAAQNMQPTAPVAPVPPAADVTIGAGVPVKEATAPVAPTVEAATGGAKFCPNCGTPTQGANFCSNCGQKLN